MKACCLNCDTTFEDIDMATVDDVLLLYNRARGHDPSLTLDDFKYDVESWYLFEEDPSDVESDTEEESDAEEVRESEPEPETEPESEEDDENDADSDN